MLNKQTFITVMTGLCDLYSKSVSEFILDTYYAIFEQYNDDEFKGAVSKCLRDRKYNTFPKPAEIIEWLEGTKDDKALIAWLQVKEAILKAGYYRSVEFADPIISNCITELGGWMELCSQPKDEIPFIEKRFLDLYRLFLKRGADKPVRLIGFFEAKNFEKGTLDNIYAPVRIGYKEKKVKQLSHSKGGL